MLRVWLMSSVGVSVTYEFSFVAKVPSLVVSWP